jgi:hypothetical protein
MKKTLFLFLFCYGLCSPAFCQRLKVGFTFQYLILKQVKVNADHLIAASSYNNYNVIDNRWKFFSAGQSFVVGTILQVDSRRFYFAMEPSWELNTYDYHVSYTLTPTSSEKIDFKTLFIQIDIPIYVGYQFKTSGLLRYSFFGGVSPVMPFHLEASLVSPNNEPGIYDRYNAYDMKNILYTGNPYFNGLAGFGIHFASLGRLDVRYVRRLNSPGNQYPVSFQSVGIGLTFFLPLHLLKKKIYYED